MLTGSIYRFDSVNMFDSLLNLQIRFTGSLLLPVLDDMCMCLADAFRVAY